MLILQHQRWPGTLVRVAGLLGVWWSVLASSNAPSGHGRGLVVAIALGLGTVAWIAWTVRSFTTRRSLTGELYVLAVSGSVLIGASTDSAGSALVFVAVVSGTIRVGMRSAAPVLVAALVALGVSALLYKVSAIGVLAYSLGLLAAMLGADNARQSTVRAEQAELLLAQTQRSHEEQLRTARLQESARIAREIHDVLAHTLAGLTIQLEATEALIDRGAEPAAVRDRVHRAHLLAREGLSETRRAVGALRDDGQPIDVAARLGEIRDRYLTDGDGDFRLTITGSPERLSVAEREAVVRTAQEAVTNVYKHAPGADVSVTLAIGDGVRLTIDNGAGRSGVAGPLAQTGGGYGLRGLDERAAVLGGTVSGVGHADGWTVELTIPGGRG